MAFRKIDMQLIETDIADIQDPLVALNYGFSGANTRDLGLLMDRGSLTNVALMWDESEDHFAIVNTTETGTTEGNIVISSYADIKANSFIGNVTGNLTGNVTGNVTGNLTGDVTGNVTGNVTGATTGAHNGTVGATTPTTGAFTTVSASSGFTGNITGNVTGNTTGINYGNVNTTVGTSSFNNVTINGNLTLNGTTTTVNSTTIEVTNSFTFEGSTADANETVLGVINPTADRTINLPDASGTLALTSDISLNTLSVTATATELNYTDGVTSNIQTQLDTKITATSTDTLENKTLRAPTFEDGSNSPKFIEQRFVNANTMRTAQRYSGGGAGSDSYLVNGEFQPVVTIIPDGSSQNYQVIGRVTVQSGGAIQVLHVNMGMRSNTLPDLSWSATYSEELTGTSTRMVTPYLWTKETTTAGFIFALGINATIYGTITCDIDIIPRSSTQQSNVTVSSNSSEVTAVTTGYTSNDFTRLYTIDQNGVIEYGSSSIRFEGSTDDAFETILTVTDPTADRTITLPDQSGTIALTSDVQANLTRNENSSPYVVTASDVTNNTGSTLAISAATLGFDLSDAVSYNIFINRLHLRSSEVSVNTGNGTITFSSDILDAADEIDAVWIT